MMVTHELIEHTCPVCFVYYALPSRMEKERRKDGKAFFCPNGHSLSYNDNEHDRIRQERDRLQQNQAWLDEQLKAETHKRKVAEKSLTATRGVVTKLTKRASAGVCPCCTRSFTNMARHMKTKHPEFKAIAVVA